LAIHLGQSRQDFERRLDLISKAWGPNRGYVFLAWIDREEQAQSGTRKAGFYEHAYRWPQDREKIIVGMEEHWIHDAYWCPSVFEFDQRKTEYAMEEYALWADLDEVDPAGIDDYPPTIAWETSPGRYQALWIVRNGDMLGASWPGGENQRLTYHIEADKGGWDTTQLLRLPAWPNHKLHYVKDNGGNPPMGQLLWKGGRWYLPDDFEDLPDVGGAGNVAEDIVEAEIDKVDRDTVLGRIKLKLPKHIREYIYARSTDGQDRSSVLWQIERSLADVGCSAIEIVAVIRELVWNKYSGRHDEIRRLILEANKAVDQRPDTDAEDDRDIVAEAAEKPALQNLFTIVSTVKRPEWLVQNIWAQGSCGFIAGQPKSWKSWVALDFCLSVASGRPFLDTFTVLRPRPVIYLQEEDSAALLKDRVEKMWPAKNQARYGLEGDEVWVEPPPDTIRAGEDLPIQSLVRAGFTISDEGWMHWLAGVLEEGCDTWDGGYGLLCIDPLMMAAGDVEENRAQEMTSKVFRPLKQLAEEYKVAICVVHHMRKQGQGQDGIRGGQLMLGSMANHAWAEDSLYITHRRGKLQVEHESKHAEGGKYMLNGLRKAGWQPSVSHNVETSGETMGAPGASSDGSATRARARRNKPPALTALEQLGRGSHTTRRVAQMMGEDATNARALAQLKRLASQGIVRSHNNREWSLTGRGPA